MDLLGTWGKRTQDWLGGARRSLLGDDLPPAEKRAATVGTFGPSVLEQTGTMLEAQEKALGRRGSVRDLLHDPDAYQAAKQVAGNLDFTGTFGGVFAKGADLGAHNMARRMKGEGVDPGTIWEQTGWFQGPDKKWRFEIDDSKAQLDLLPMAQKQAGTKDWLWSEDAIKHPELYEAYPSARDIEIDITKSGGPLKGSYQEPKHSDLAPKITLQSDTTPEMRSTALHELQHHLQREEGFARGGMPESAASQFYDDINKRMSEIVRKKDRATGAEKQALQDEYDRLMNEKMKANPNDLYRRLAGEAEARLVQSRRSLTAEERRMLYPWLGYDVPPEQQIVRGVRD
jgi:hypothetical protein